MAHEKYNTSKCSPLTHFHLRMWRTKTYTSPNKARSTKCLHTLALCHSAIDRLLIITIYLHDNNDK